MLRTQFEEIRAHEQGTRLGADPEALHKLRVAVRRLRTVLRVCRPVLDRTWARALRVELRWLARSLADARDLDVLLVHLHEQSESFAARDQSALADLIGAVERQREDAHAQLIEALDSDRYRALLGELTLAATAPRMAGRRRSLRKLARREFRQLRRAVDALGAEPTDERLHKARVQAKRARYAAELAEASVGKPAARFVQRAKRLQDVIGEHQDAVVAEEVLRKLARGRRTRIAFAAGELVERQRQRRFHARAELPRAWKQLRSAGRKTWR